MGVLHHCSDVIEKAYGAASYFCAAGLPAQPGVVEQKPATAFRGTSFDWCRGISCLTYANYEAQRAPCSIASM